jgi:hypothetical protein
MSGGVAKNLGVVKLLEDKLGVRAHIAQEPNPRLLGHWVQISSPRISVEITGVSRFSLTWFLASN